MFLILRFEGKSRTIRIVFSGLLFAILFLPFDLQQDSPDATEDYIPIAKVRSMRFKIANSRAWKDCQGGEVKAGLTKDLADFTPAFSQSFLGVDRKQNLLLWPVVSSGLIRSPPSSHTS